MVQSVAMVILIGCSLPCTGSATESASPGGFRMRYQEAWYLENGLQDVEQAAEVYREVAAARRAEPALAARAMLRLAACTRHLGREAQARSVEATAQQRFPDAIKQFPSYRLSALHKQFDEAFDVGGSTTGGHAIERFLASLDAATVHSICEACYDQAAEAKARDPLGSVPAFRKAIAISTTLRQFERSAYAQKDVGDIHAAAGQPAAAIAAYRKVQRDFPMCPSVVAWAIMSLAETHRLAGHLAEAVEAYRMIERRYPSQLPQALWAQLWMGDAFRAAGKMADARAAWRRVLEEFNDPDYADQIAIAAQLLGQAAIAPIRVPDDEFANDVAYFRAVRHEMAQEWDQAAKYYGRCIATSRGNDWPRALAVRALEAARREAKR